MQFIDLSMPVETNKSLYVKVKYHSHRASLLAIRLMYGIKKKYLRTGLGWANETIRLSSCSVTHLEAPWHYTPISEGKPAMTIDQVPLDWCFKDGVKIDMRHKRDGEEISVDEIKAALEKIDYKIKPFDIVLINTGNDRYLGTSDYQQKGSGVSAEATEWIVDQGVKIAGIDSCVWCLPLPQLAQKTIAAKGKRYFWDAYQIAVDKEWCCLERLVNLDELPSHGFKVCCFPLKLKRGAAGPSRVVAMVE